MFAVDTLVVYSRLRESSSAGKGEGGRGLMHGMKIPQQDFALKMQGGEAYSNIL